MLSSLVFLRVFPALLTLKSSRIAQILLTQAVEGERAASDRSQQRSVGLFLRLDQRRLYCSSSK